MAKSHGKGEGGRPPRKRASSTRKPTGKNALERTKEQAQSVNQQLTEQATIPANRGNVVVVFGADPVNKYALRYEVRELDNLITSNVEGGSINPDYPVELQPRDRTRKASRRQVEKMARNLESNAMVSEFNSLDRGAPIVGDDNVVESGNARTMALKRAEQLHPDKFDEYKDAIKAVARERGIDPNVVDQYQNPVLVRVRVDDVDRVRFAREANTMSILGMSDTERAQSDAERLSSENLTNFVSSDQGINADLRKKANRTFVRSFISRLPETERAEMMGRSGEITQAGTKRIKAAMFTRVYHDTRLSDRIFESPDNDMRNITGGLMGSLGAMARAEEMVQSGQREKNLSITSDVTAAVGQMAAIKESGKMSVDMYLSQTSMFGDDITPLQKDILVALHERRRSGKKVKELMSGWANIVESQSHPDQMGMFGGAKPAKKELVTGWLAGKGQRQKTLL